MTARLLLACLLAIVVTASATPAGAEKGRLAERLTPEVMAVVVPGAARLGPEEGSPPAIAVYKDGDDKPAAWVFSTLDVIAAPGYASTPFDVIAGVDPQGRITGAKVVFHREPYIYHDAVRQPLLDQFLAREAGAPLRGGAPRLPPEFVAGASISSRAMRAAIVETARLVLRARVARAAVTVPTLDTEGFALLSWQDLVAEGAVARLTVTSRDLTEALARAGAPGAVPEVAPGPPDDLYIEVMTGLATPSAIGGNLIGLRAFEDYRRRLNGGQAIFVASNGRYDFLGTRHYRDAEGRRFDRLRIVQHGRTIGFVNDDYQRIGTGAKEGIRAQDNAGLFAVPANAGFDPLEPWRLELLIHAEGAAGAPVTVAFPLDYRVPPAHVLMPDAPPAAAFVEAWRDARVNIAILVALLAALTAIFVFQDALARSRRAHRLVRTGFLMVVLGWLGWTAGVQLSIVNVVNYLQAPWRRFDAGFYLAEPLMVIVAAYTLISVVLIGRGVFCGWLCPFGALQELLARAAQALEVPQWNPPQALSQRLWWGKYVAAAAVLAAALSGLDAVAGTTEIEPFKTAITSKFTRALPYVLYAGGLLAVGLFCERAYCRFLCPLGGVLAVLDRLHLLNLLKRRRECGNPCHLCERSCPVHAIEPTGRIVMAECFQCLDCQVEYHDPGRCPPLARARQGGAPPPRSRPPVAAAVARRGAEP